MCYTKFLHEKWLLNFSGEFCPVPKFDFIGHRQKRLLKVLSSEF
jgi:hypothetical protein